MAKYTLHYFLRIANDFVPETFGRLTTIGPKYQIRKRAYITCSCSCGEVVVAREGHLKSGATSSCGCFHAQTVTVHGIRANPSYESWHQMRQRCNNHNHHAYRNYGGRGIKVHGPWDLPQGCVQFLADMGTRPQGMTLDRIDVDGDYTPENCRWATWDEQANNRRNTVYMTMNGKTQPLCAWAEEIGVSRSTLRKRIKEGMSDEQALTTPVNTRKTKDGK